MPVLFLRVDDDIHELLSAESRRSGWTINRLAAEMLRDALNRPSPASNPATIARFSQLAPAPSEKKPRKRKKK